MVNAFICNDAVSTNSVRHPPHVDVQVLIACGAKMRGRVKMMICEQVCSAMCELHEEKVLHRDLAARNILCLSMDPVHIKVSALTGTCGRWVCVCCMRV